MLAAAGIHVLCSNKLYFYTNKYRRQFCTGDKELGATNWSASHFCNISLQLQKSRLDALAPVFFVVVVVVGFFCSCKVAMSFASCKNKKLFCHCKDTLLLQNGPPFLQLRKINCCCKVYVCSCKSVFAELCKCAHCSNKVQHATCLSDFKEVAHVRAFVIVHSQSCLLLLSKVRNFLV